MLARQDASFMCKSLLLFRFSVRNLQYHLLTQKVLSKPITNAATRSDRSSSFLVYGNTQITKHGRNGRVEEAESVFRRMPFKNTVSWTAMLTAYGDNGRIREARQMFDEMPERNTASYNAMITAYVRNNWNVSKAYELFAEIPDRNVVSYGAMITGFVQAGMVEKAKELYLSMPVKWRDPACSNALISGYLKLGALEEAIWVFEGMAQRDVVSWSSMLDGYCKNVGISAARKLFDKMPERNVVSWTAMINGYMKMGHFECGFDLFQDMRKEGTVRVNSTTLTVMLEACGDFGRSQEGIQTHGLVFQLGHGFDLFIRNSIIKMYSTFGFVDDAVKIFDSMDERNEVTWNSLISAYVQNDSIEEAYRLFAKMPGKDAVSWTTIISGFFGNRMIDRSIKLFEIMPVKDGIAWTAMISGFVKNSEFEEAFHWYIQMLQKAIKPNPLTLSSVLCASAGLAALNHGVQIHAHVVKMDLEHVLSIQNSLISMYSKCGSVLDAYRIFTETTDPNIVSYNSIITGLAQNGFGTEALRLFKMMQSSSQQPNEVTLLAILSACTHEGLVREGWNYFKSMKSLYGIEPGPDHYACIIDLLGRAGLLDEAICLISSMPLEPHPGVWGALLSASKIHSRVDLAELAAQRLIKLQPDNATSYVVLSNIYYTSGKQDFSDHVRMAQKSKRVRKSPGCSWIMLKDSVHLFLAGDKSHSNIRDIEATLCTISKEVELLES
ncbi:hypothetical protein BT93_D0740 [Corymbia citriodora subsp. variegata]|nr:hypothetical protein BT93_D0740 [Corymbia citriodora subsp. variegata]